MISIITAIRNHLDMNRLYWEKLKEYTTVPFELIIIDNASTDGSEEFFESVGAKVIKNQANYSYPHCQNQGIAVAQYDVFAFFNNDIIVCPHWDTLLLGLMSREKIDFISPASNDRVENTEATKKMVKRWKYVKYPLLFLGGHGYRSLTLMHRLMYGNWERFCQTRQVKFGSQTIQDFSGSCVLVTRSGMNKLGGGWDTRVQSADFDMYMQVLKRSQTHGDVRPMQLALGVYFHHFAKLTLRSRYYLPFADAAALISIEDKWGSEMGTLLADLDTDAGKTK